MISWTRPDRDEARERQKYEGREDVSRAAWRCWRMFNFGSDGCGKDGCDGGRTALRIASKAKRSWQRADTSGRVRSRVGSMVSARERLLSEATVAFWT
jgi:hypothetical protein